MKMFSFRVTSLQQNGCVFVITTARTPMGGLHLKLQLSLAMRHLSGDAWKEGIGKIFDLLF